MLFDRIDAPLTGPLAIALAQAGASSDAVPHNVQIVLADNGRDKAPFDQAGYIHQMRALCGMPTTGTTDTTPATPATPASEPELEADDAPELPPGVMSAADFLQAD